MGKAMAQPTPPPTTATLPRPWVWEGVPKGPAKSWMKSPSSRRPRAMVEAPTSWKMMVTVPFSRS